MILNIRLRHDFAQGKVFHDARTEVASHNPRTITNGFVENGITDPVVVDQPITVEAATYPILRWIETNNQIVCSIQVGVDPVPVALLRSLDTARN